MEGIIDTTKKKKTVIISYISLLRAHVTGRYTRRARRHERTSAWRHTHTHAPRWYRELLQEHSDISRRETLLSYIAMECICVVHRSRWHGDGNHREDTGISDMFSNNVKPCPKTTGGLYSDTRLDEPTIRYSYKHGGVLTEYRDLGKAFSIEAIRLNFRSYNHTMCSDSLSW